MRCVGAGVLFAVVDAPERDRAVVRGVSPHGIAAVGLARREDERAIVGVDRVLIGAIEEGEVAREVVRPRAELFGHGVIVRDRLHDPPGAFDLGVSLGAHGFADAAAVRPGGALFFAEAAAELLAEAEEGQTEIEGPVGALLEAVRGADDPVLAGAGREVALEQSRRRAGFARVELDDRLSHLGRVAVERPRGIPGAGREQRQQHEQRSSERDAAAGDVHRAPPPACAARAPEARLRRGASPMSMSAMRRTTAAPRGHAYSSA